MWLERRYTFRFSNSDVMSVTQQKQKLWRPGVSMKVFLSELGNFLAAIYMALGRDERLLVPGCRARREEFGPGQDQLTDLGRHHFCLGFPR